MGEATRSAVQDVVFRQIDRIRVKGKDEAITVYEPLGEVDEVYLKKVQSVRRNPPPPDWDGVTVFAEK